MHLSTFQMQVQGSMGTRPQLNPWGLANTCTTMKTLQPLGWKDKSNELHNGLCNHMGGRTSRDATSPSQFLSKQNAGTTTTWVEGLATTYFQNCYMNTAPTEYIGIHNTCNSSYNRLCNHMGGRTSHKFTYVFQMMHNSWHYTLQTLQPRGWKDLSQLTV